MRETKMYKHTIENKSWGNEHTISENHTKREDSDGTGSGLVYLYSWLALRSDPWLPSAKWRLDRGPNPLSDPTPML